MKDDYKRAKAKMRYCNDHDISAVSCGCSGLGRRARQKIKRDARKELIDHELDSWLDLDLVCDY